MWDGCFDDVDDFGGGVLGAADAADAVFFGAAALDDAAGFLLAAGFELAASLELPAVFDLIAALLDAGVLAAGAADADELLAGALEVILLEVIDDEITGWPLNTGALLGGADDAAISTCAETLTV